MSLPETCPFCGAGTRAVKDGNQSWVEFKCFSMIGNVAGEFQYRSPICRHAELNAAKARIAEMENCIETITDGFQREQNDIEQTCGKVLGYPRYCDDQKTFLVQLKKTACASANTSLHPLPQSLQTSIEIY